MYKGKSFRIRFFAICVLLASLCAGMLSARAETDRSWQSGTLIQVKAHEVTSADNVVSKQYEITVQVGNKIYLGSYTAKDGEPELEYYVGMARMVLIDGDTLTFNDLLGRAHSMRITS